MSSWSAHVVLPSHVPLTFWNLYFWRHLVLYKLMKRLAFVTSYNHNCFANLIITLALGRTLPCLLTNYVLADRSNPVFWYFICEQTAASHRINTSLIKPSKLISPFSLQADFKIRSFFLNRMRWLTLDGLEFDKEWIQIVSKSMDSLYTDIKEIQLLYIFNTL